MIDFSIKLSEAKAQFSHINSSIKETREKTYILLGICFGIIGFLLADLFEGNLTSLKSKVLYISIPFVTYVFFSTIKSVNPLKLRLDGISPNSFEEISADQNGDQAAIEDSILYTYQISINTNGSYLTSLSKGYKNSFFVMFIWLLCALGFLVIESFKG